jgi:hypothetical protein
LPGVLEVTCVRRQQVHGVAHQHVASHARNMRSAGVVAISCDKHAQHAGLRAAEALGPPIVAHGDCVIDSAHSNIHPATTVDSNHEQRHRSAMQPK